jgi:aspartyl aminopeptidase
MRPDTSCGLELREFISKAPSPFHATAEVARRLAAAGFAPASADGSRDGGGRREYLVRDGTVLAWHVPGTATAATPVRIIAAHTDSPTLKLKPRPDAGAGGWLQAGVEVYGSPLWNSWLDRDLGLAGRLVLRDGSVVLVAVDQPLLRIPQLAHHLDREVNDRGLKLNPQQHLRPVWGIGQVRQGELIELLADQAGVGAADVLAHDLVLQDVAAPVPIGRNGELMAAPRLDNLSSVHAGLAGFLTATGAGSPEVRAGPILVFAAFDHEEVGSRSATGAAGPLLENVLRHIWPALGAGQLPDGPAITESCCLSADAMNAVHPNYLDLYDPDHRVIPNEGPALKVNANQNYASDAIGAAAWARVCQQADIPSQVFVSRNDVRCGSTIGPIIATRLGIRTVDVGMPVLSMHSARELCGSADPGYLAAACAAFLEPAEISGER